MAGALPAEIADALRALQYDRRWLDYGVLTPAVLLAQSEEQRSLPHPEDEHFRCGAMFDYLGSLARISDGQLARVIELMEVDPDAVMAASVLSGMVMGHPGLTDAQFERVAAHASCRPFTKKIERIRLQRLRRSGGATESWFRSAVDLPDDATHRAVLAEEHVPRWALEYLEQHGVNKGVRNRAAELLKGPRYRM